MLKDYYKDEEEDMYWAEQQFELIEKIGLQNWLAMQVQKKNQWEIIMNEKETVLSAMKKAGEPLSAGKVAELTGLDRKVVDKVFAEMKKDGSIVSPVRCKWEPANK